MVTQNFGSLLSASIIQFAGHSGLRLIAMMHHRTCTGTGWLYMCTSSTVIRSRSTSVFCVVVHVQCSVHVAVHVRQRVGVPS